MDFIFKAIAQGNESLDDYAERWTKQMLAGEMSEQEWQVKMMGLADSLNDPFAFGWVFNVLQTDCGLTDDIADRFWTVCEEVDRARFPSTNSAE